MMADLQISVGVRVQKSGTRNPDSLVAECFLLEFEFLNVVGGKNECNLMAYEEICEGWLNLKSGSRNRDALRVDSLL
jgi:hypothetical protein